MAIRGKKAYFFTLMVVISLSLVFMYFTMGIDPGQSREVDVAGQRLVEINRFIDSVENDAQTAVHVASFRSFLELQNFMTSNYEYIDDLDETYETLILTGFLGTNEPDFLSESALVDWENRMVELAEQLHYELQFDDQKIIISQDDPWSVKTIYSFNLTLEDDFSNSFMQRELSVESSVPLSLLYDPVYLVEAGIVQKITQGSFENGDSIDGDYYMAMGRGPSYLSRLEGDLDSDDGSMGLENLVNVLKVGGVGVINPGRSIIDWQYFDTTPHTTCHILNYPDWAIIDVNYIASYGLVCG